MKNKIEVLVHEFFPNDTIKANELLSEFGKLIVKDIERYAESQYRKYVSSTNYSIRNDDWILGTSEGADHCVKLLEKMLDKS